MNKVVLIGRLTKDPELRFAAGSGTAVARFTLAVNRQFKKDEADFISCIAFGKTGETIAQYITKGRQLAISGNIRTGSYEAQDGTRRYTTDVVVESFDFIDSSNRENKGPNSNFDIANSNFENSMNNGSDEMIPIDDSDIPF
ncbi:single-stranded DNA-binding protein [Clostridium perfringens]|uniref:single-stranded DNA-binding protein n=1 Tax=Clostridium perfringens TaxID=1502 RepID=UPI0015708AA6|nr:single-stranded DNA-binding protein [Clostridium perfringens]EGT0690948.1 single-stranded DNA-binding protein [Clostridium perfringens]EGT0694100.1 single-stranded DNA-binding protein [Clostridium perfringens]MBI6024424.1 single-stranded DNA-binding protein [Clostridium perfringens]MBI6048789.1 single-stranded DNA-binding protein [Clostridium perfringens]MDK0575139.1 single-stranded DNA-binding protein [Clostridium perfringens]